MWQLPGGKIDEGEPPSEAAAREVKEETGLSFTSLRLFREKKGRWFYVGDWEGKLALQKTEVSDAEWFSVSETATLPMSKTQRDVLNDLHGARLLD